MVGLNINHLTLILYCFQIRYNNPLLNQALYDNSGISLIYTRNPQILEMGTKLISVTHFTIPSGSKNTAITAEYPQQCSAIQISQPIFITGAFIHMHKFGKKNFLYCFNLIIRLPPLKLWVRIQLMARCIRYNIMLYAN